jgi:hypothetical protein
MSRVHVLRAQPWRFMPGDRVFVRGWTQLQTGLILCQLESYAWPHYIVADEDGGEWRISQLELSSLPIITP